MKILIFGASGMVGHKMYRELSSLYPDTYATFRRSLSELTSFGLFNPSRTIDLLDVNDFDRVKAVLKDLRPQLILNCVGITLRKPESSDLSLCMELNSLFPHRLKCWVAQNGARLIHFSTDCVFNGLDKEYWEDSPPTATDIYGRTKYLGEVVDRHCLTLRGSMFGRELTGKTELFEWCLAQRGRQVNGYSNAIYSGVSTAVMARLVKKVIQQEEFPAGLFQVSSTPISKFALLKKLNEAFSLDMEIIEDPTYRSTKILSSRKVRERLGFICPSWEDMIAEMVRDSTLYDVDKDSC